MMTEQEYKDLAKNTLDQMTELLGYGANSTVLPGEHDNFKLSLASEAAGRIIGRKGQALEALELLLNRILKKNDENAPWVPVEVDGYSTGHTGAPPERHGILDDDTVMQLEAMAKDTAKEVKHWKKAKRLGPYLPAERRVIHTALKDDPDVTTESIPAPEVGERMKYIEIKLS